MLISKLNLSNLGEMQRKLCKFIKIRKQGIINCSIQVGGLSFSNIQPLLLWANSLVLYIFSGGTYVITLKIIACT